MSQALLFIATIAVLVLIGLLVMALRRSWGSSFESTGAPRRSADLPEAERQAVLALCRAGNKIAAIKRVRELTDVGLKQAKEYVDALETGMAPEPSFDREPPRTPDLAEVHAIAQAGNKIGAIKLYRELTGVGLKQAKDYVDALAAGHAPAPAASGSPASAGSLDQVHTLAQAGNKIGAIKLYRELTGVGLKQAKDYVDSL